MGGSKNVKGRIRRNDCSFLQCSMIPCCSKSLNAFLKMAWSLHTPHQPVPRSQEYHSSSVCARCSQNCSSCAWAARISMELNLTLCQEFSFIGSLAVEGSQDTGTKPDDIFHNMQSP